MSLFDDSMLIDVEEYQRHADHLAARLNAALRDLNLADFNEGLAVRTEAGAYIVLRIPTARADRLVRALEDLATVVS